MLINRNKKKKDVLKKGDSEFFPSAMRDMYYSALVRDVVSDNRVSKIMKCIFFALVCFVFVFTCCYGMITIYNISERKSISASDIGIAFTALGGVLGSIIVLPTTIANHLFPANGEKERFEFISDIQKYDSYGNANPSEEITELCNDSVIEDSEAQ